MDKEKQIEEIHKMAQIALGKQVTMECTKFAIEEGFFDNFIALYNAGYRKIYENSVVLTEQEFDEFREDSAKVKFLKKEIEKQAVKEVLEKTKEKCKELEDKFSHLCKSKKECLMETCRYEGVLAVKRELNEIAKEFGVEL